MTNNQRAFQRELNRLQKSILNLQKKGYVQNVDLPDIPKRVTTKAIEELKLKRGKHYVTEPSTLKHQAPTTRKPIKSAKENEYVHKPGQSQSDEERRAKRREYYANNREAITAKQRQWREANRDKVHESSKKSYQKHRDENLAKGKAKRERAKNTATGDPYTPEYDMVEWLLNRINQARADFADRFDDWQARHGYSARIPEQFYRRASLLNELYNLVSTSYANAGGYYDIIKEREEEISELLNVIVWYDNEGDFESAFTELHVLLTPKGDVSLQERKRFTEMSDDYIEGIYG